MAAAIPALSRNSDGLLAENDGNYPVDGNHTN